MKSLVPAEFLRFFGTRLWLLHLAAALACGLGLVGLVAVVGPENSDPPLPPLGSPEGAGVLLQFVQMTLFVPAALGTFAITSEFRHRTIGSTFLAEPRRGRVMAAKLTVHGVIGLAYGVILAAGAGAASGSARSSTARRWASPPATWSRPSPGSRWLRPSTCCSA